MRNFVFFIEKKKQKKVWNGIEWVTMKLRLLSQYTGYPRHENNTGYRAHFRSRAISVTEQSFVSSFEALHIGYVLCYTFVQCKQVIELWMNK